MSKVNNKTITSPQGFLAAGLHCGVKHSGQKDLGLIVCPGGAKAAAVFTTNRIVSAAVTLSKRHIKGRSISAVVVNSGNANACTGKSGRDDALKMCSITAEKLGVRPRNVLVASTGIIGERLPVKKIGSGIKKAVKGLCDSAVAGQAFAESILTTDTKVKQAVRRIRISGRNITITGTAKGAGMIAPQMATTLCFITTDAAISKPLLGRALKTAVGGSLNKLTVDGHQSTNDTAIILTSGLAGNPVIRKTGTGYRKFGEALADLCLDLARQMAMDAEGATRIFKVVVKGAASKKDAAVAARAVADYNLVKCAVYGGDANWGRIICAVGSSAVKLNAAKLSCKIGAVTVYRNGRGVKFDVQKAKRFMREPEHTITVNLAAGRYSDFCYGCDLSEEYVRINAQYHT